MTLIQTCFPSILIAFFQPLTNRVSRILLLTQIILLIGLCIVQFRPGNHASNFKSALPDLKSRIQLLPELYFTQSYCHY